MSNNQKLQMDQMETVSINLNFLSVFKVTSLVIVHARLTVTVFFYIFISKYLLFNKTYLLHCTNTLRTLHGQMRSL